MENWTELETMHRTGDKQIHDRMKAILNPIERLNDKLLKFGSGASIYFGK